MSKITLEMTFDEELSESKMKKLGLVMSSFLYRRFFLDEDYPSGDIKVFLSKEVKSFSEDK